MNQPRRGPLARFRILDLTRLRSGPTAVRQLADWGGDVIKIETPEALGASDGWGDSRLGPDFQNLHRNKRSLTLNLKAPWLVPIDIASESTPVRFTKSSTSLGSV